MSGLTLAEALYLPPGTKLIFPKVPHGLSDLELGPRIARAVERIRNSSSRSGLTLARSLVFYSVASNDWIIRDEIGLALGITLDQITAERELMNQESRLGIRHAAPEDLVDYPEVTR